MTRFETYLRGRWWVILGAAFLLVLFSWLCWQALDAISYRHKKDQEAVAIRAKLVGLAEDVKAQNDQLLSVAKAIDGATSQEAKDRSNAVLAGAIAEIRRSIDCTKLDDEGTYPACVDVAGRLDAIRAGDDPFTPPPGGTP